MSDQNRFFRFLWRVNAILITGAGLFVLGMAAWTHLHPYQEPIAVPEGHFAPVPKSAEQANTYRLQAYPIVTLETADKAKHEVLYSLGDWNGQPNVYGLASISGPVDKRRPAYTANVLAVDTNTTESHWLFRGYKRNIINWGPLSSASGQVVQPIPIAATTVILQVIERDTDKDGELSAGDRLTLYGYHIGAGVAVKFLEVDLIRDVQQIDANKFMVVFENGRTATAAIFSLPDFKPLSWKPLPNVPK